MLLNGNRSYAFIIISIRNRNSRLEIMIVNLSMLQGKVSKIRQKLSHARKYAQEPPEEPVNSSFRTVIGSVCLRSPVMTASGTAGRSNELGGYGPLDQLGAVVIKSLSVESWVGNKAPRLAPVRAGMINSVGLQGPGISAWLNNDLPTLADSGADVVASIWGTTVKDYHTAAEMLQSDIVNIACVK